MPLSTLRRRTVNEPLSPQEERSSPSPHRAPTTSTAVTPRKSLQSLIGSVRKRGTTTAVMKAGGEAHIGATGGRSVTPSPRQSIIEQTHYSSHDRSKYDLAAFRTPSPHPGKVSASSSKAKVFKSDSSRTFLETLADAIRAPANLFYKEKKQKSENSGPLAASEVDATTEVNSEVDRHVNSHSPTKSLISKKSVRFKRANSIIESSSPIDIPKPAPYLPPMHLATTPLFECFGRKMVDPIPTGRPRTPPVLQSTQTFRQAMAEAQECFAKDVIPPFSPLGSTVSEDATPPPAKAARLENPFRERLTVSELFVKRLLQSDDVPSGKEDFLCTAVPEQEPARNEMIQVLPDSSSNDTRLANASPCSSLEGDTHITNTSPATKPTNNSPSTLLPSNQITTNENVQEGSFSSFSVHHYDSNPEDAGEKPACPRHSTPKSRQINKKWLIKPTLEDIRGRFKHPDRYDVSSSDQMDPFSDENGFSDSTVCAKDTITASPDTVAGMGLMQPPSSAFDQQSEAFQPGTTKYLRSSSEGVSPLHVSGRFKRPNSSQNPISPTSFIRNPPWSSELALRDGKSSSTEELNAFVPSRTQRRLSSFEGAESDREGRAGLPLEQTEDSIGYLLSGIETAHQQLPGRTVAREMQTPSPALIPLPLSRHVPASSTMNLETAEYDLWPFEDDSYSNNFFLPLGYNRRECSSNLSSEKCVPSPFDEAAPLSDSDKGFSSLNSDSEMQGHVNDRDTSENIARVTPGEQLSKAAAAMERFESRKSNGSSDQLRRTSCGSSFSPL